MQSNRFRSYRYKGWTIYQGPSHPVTGLWRAVRFGVGMGHNTLEGLQRMIDRRVAEEPWSLPWPTMT